MAKPKCATHRLTSQVIWANGAGPLAAAFVWTESRESGTLLRLVARRTSTLRIPVYRYFTAIDIRGKIPGVRRFLTFFRGSFGHRARCDGRFGTSPRALLLAGLRAIGRLSLAKLDTKSAKSTGDFLTALIVATGAFPLAVMTLFDQNSMNFWGAISVQK